MFVCEVVLNRNPVESRYAEVHRSRLESYLLDRNCAWQAVNRVGNVVVDIRKINLVNYYLHILVFGICCDLELWCRIEVVGTLAEVEFDVVVVLDMVVNCQVSLIEGVLAEIDFVQIDKHIYRALVLLYGECEGVAAWQCIAVSIAKNVICREFKVQYKSTTAIDAVQTVEINRNVERRTQRMILATELHPVDLLQLFEDGNLALE